MNAASNHTYFPSEDSAEGIREVASFVYKYRNHTGANPAPQFFLSGPNEHQQVALPQEIYDVLVTAVDALQRGMAVTIRPDSERVTTQQAADILGVSRPTVVRLVDSGALPAEMIGRHRRILLADVLAHQSLRRIGQLDAIVATSDRDAEIPDAEFFKSARKASAAARRERA